MGLIIGISGKMGSGKDTAAKIIKEYFKEKNFEIIHFADPLKMFCIDYLGVNHDDVYTENGKKSFNTFWNMTNREILQKIGTDCLRNHFDKNIWVKIIELKIKKSKNINFLIPDVRFDNEAEMILNNGGVVLNIERIAQKQDSHSSEKGISENFITKTIKNDKTLDIFQNEVVEFFKNYI